MTKAIDNGIFNDAKVSVIDDIKAVFTGYLDQNNYYILMQ